MGKNNTKKTLEEVKELFAERNFEILDDIYVNAHTKMHCKCRNHPNKGVQMISYADIKYGNTRCPWCDEENGRPVRNPSDEYLKEVTERNGKEYSGTFTKDQKRYIKFICPLHGDAGIQEQMATDMKLGKNGCRICNGTRRTREEFQKEVCKINPLIEVGEDFKGSKFYVSCRCKECGHNWSTKAYNLLTGYGCPNCSRIEAGKKRRLSAEEIYSRLPEDVELLDAPDTLLSHDVAHFRCKTCSYEWEAMLSNLIKPKPTGCPSCKTNKTENRMLSILENMGFNIARQYKFQDCCDIKPLPFDGYDAEKNIAFEYDGEGHFMPIPFNSKQSADDIYERCVKHDKIKNEYCKSHGIHLIRVPYWESDNMESYIQKKLKEIA